MGRVKEGRKEEMGKERERERREWKGGRKEGKKKQLL